MTGSGLRSENRTPTYLTGDLSLLTIKWQPLELGGYVTIFRGQRSRLAKALFTTLILKN
jgi:hypothetical protein